MREQREKQRKPAIPTILGVNEVSGVLHLGIWQHVRIAVRGYPIRCAGSSCYLPSLGEIPGSEESHLHTHIYVVKV